jgi:iron complex transport system substrate-binding protein
MARPTLRRFSILAAFAAFVLAGACGARTPAPAAPTTRSVVDDLGRSVAVASRPTRIVSLAPNLTEILFAVGAGDRVVADTSYCNYPPEAAAKPHVGDTQRPDLERLIALEPDLVLVSTASQLQSLSERLAALGIPTYVSNPRDFDGVVASVERIGDLVGEADAGRRLAATLRERTAAVGAAVAGRPSPKVFFVVGEEPLITAGKGTFVDDLIRRAGGASITADETTEWPQFSAETVVARAPDVIVLPGSSHGVEGLPASIRETPAARSGRIVSIDGDLLMRPGPRLVDGLERLARELHPEAFR